MLRMPRANDRHRILVPVIQVHVARMHHVQCEACAIKVGDATWRLNLRELNWPPKLAVRLWQVEIFLDIVPTEPFANPNIVRSWLHTRQSVLLPLTYIEGDNFLKRRSQGESNHRIRVRPILNPKLELLWTLSTSAKNCS